MENGKVKMQNDNLKFKMKEIDKALELNKNIFIVGTTNSGKSFFVVNKLIPHLQNNRKVHYFPEGPEIKSDISKDDNKIFIFDEVEILFDKEFLEKRYPDEKPYYSEKYLNDVRKWHIFYKEYSEHNPCIYVVTRNSEEEIKYLDDNFKKAEWDGKEVEVIKFPF